MKNKIHFFLSGRKFGIKELQNRITTKTHKFMRLKDDQFYLEMNEEELRFEYQRINETFKEKWTKDRLVTEIKRLHRTRHYVCWHDGSSVSNRSHLLVMMGCVYDPALYYTDKEYLELTGIFKN